MAEITVEVVNGSDQTVRLRLEEDGDLHKHLQAQVRREELKSVTKVTAPARKPASK